MAGLDPAIHAYHGHKERDVRDKPWHDDLRGSC